MIARLYNARLFAFRQYIRRVRMQLRSFVEKTYLPLVPLVERTHCKRDFQRIKKQKGLPAGGIKKMCFAQKVYAYECISRTNDKVLCLRSGYKPKRIQAIKEFPENNKNIKQFLGLAERFISNFSKSAKFLRDLFKKEEKLV